MPVYVYGCSKDKEHPRQEVSHGIDEVIQVKCQECGAEMHRIPQAFRFYMDPRIVLADRIIDKFNPYRRNKQHERS